MHQKSRFRTFAAPLFFAAAAATVVATVVATTAARAAAGDPPPSSLDLGAAKPKQDATSSVLNPGGILPVGQSSLLKPKTSADTSAMGAPGVGTAIKTPIGSKGVLGVTGANSTQPAQDDNTSSNDVVVKMPSNMKK